jgi:N-acetylgalactosamine-6-sulfatase
MHRFLGVFDLLLSSFAPRKHVPFAERKATIGQQFLERFFFVFALTFQCVSVTRARFMMRLLIPLLLITSACSAFAAERPNILFIYADDWGWGDLACHGHLELKTPHLDQLAREGSDFHQFTVCNPVCSPSRVAIVTGHFPARYSIHQHFASHQQNVERGMPDWLDTSAPLLPRMFKEAGYRTAHYGKWHLTGGGIDDAPHPRQYGYDDSAVYVGPGRHVFDGMSMEKLVRDAAAHDEVAACYLTTAATENALRFIRECKDAPFFVNLWLHETHHLVSATEEDKRAYPDTPEPQRTYYSAVTRADGQIGRVLLLLEELGKSDSTIVIFSSDNGPEITHPERNQKFYYSVGSTGGLRGRKRSLYLGGVGTPFIVRWPGKVPAGRVDRSSPIAGVDMMPTLLAVAGIPLPKGYVPDGENILPLLRGESQTRSKPIFWEWQGNHTQAANWPIFGMRDGPWTLLVDESGARRELYQVLSDREQQHNLAGQRGDRASSMLAAIRQWKATLPKSPSQHARSRIASQQPRQNPARPTPNRARAFQRWDRNTDGVLTLEEYTAGLANKARAELRFKNFDTNGDGKLTREEFIKP